MCEHVISWENKGRNLPIDGSAVKQKDVEGKPLLMSVSSSCFVQLGPCSEAICLVILDTEKERCVCACEKER